MIDCVMRGRDGSQYTIQYDPRNNVLSQDGVPYSGDADGITPPRKCLAVRLSIGKKCNFRCRYCLVEALKNGNHWEPEALPPDVLAREIKRFAGDREIGSVQFWGGEPLLPENFERIKALHAALLSVGQGGANFFLSTNGSLLYGDRLDWLLENTIAVSISWDGPGQRLRGPDILKDARVLESVLRLLRSGPDRVTFNPVMTSENRSYGDYVDMLEKALGREDFRLSEAKLSTVGDDAAWAHRVPEDALSAYSSGYYQFLLQDKGRRLGVHYVDATGFVCGLGAISEGVRCFATDPGALTLDMAGNILTCQNFSADAVDARGERHCLGSIFDLPAGAVAPMPALTRWKERRKDCLDCAVRFICRGGCPYTPEQYREYNCLAGYYQSLPVFALALHIITGDLLAEITPGHSGERHA